MLFLFVFSLITLTDPFPNLFGGSTRVRVQSQAAPLPLPQKYPVFERKIKPVNNRSNESIQEFHKSSNLEAFSTQRNVSTQLAPVRSVSAVKVEKRNSKRVTSGNETGESTLISRNWNEPTVKKPFSGVSTFSNGLRTTQKLEVTPVPLLLKLDKEYTPTEIAEYIFSTGDETGFAQGIAEMIEDGQLMVSRDDVIAFLEAVQKELANFRKQRDEEGRSGGDSGEVANKDNRQ